MLGNIIVSLIIAAIIIGAIAKIVSDRRNGIRCPGCLDSKACGNDICSCQSPLGPVINNDNINR